MSLLRANFALNIQAIQSGVWQTMKLDNVEENVMAAPRFRLQHLSETTNKRFKTAMNNARQKTSPFYGVADGNVALWNDFIKDCLIEFGLKDWDGITRVDLMSDKDISDKTLSLVRENIDPIVAPDNQNGLPSVYLESKYLGNKDEILKDDGRAIYHDELFLELAGVYSLESGVVNSLIDKAEGFFEEKVPCTQKNIKDFFNEPRNALAFRFCREACLTDKPYKSSFTTKEIDNDQI